MKTLERCASALTKSLGICLVVLLVIMTVTMTMQVFFRFVLNTGLTWSDELSRYCMIYVTLLGMAMIVGDNEHIAIEVLDMFVSPAVLKWIRVLRVLFSLAFFVIVILSSFKSMAIAATNVSTSMGIPMTWIYGIFPVGFSLAILYGIVVFLKILTPSKSAENEGGKH